MDFENRLQSLNASSASPAEVVAAVNAYERLVTAKAICASVIGAHASEAAVLHVFSALSVESVRLLEQLEKDVASGEPS